VEKYLEQEKKHEWEIQASTRLGKYLLPEDQKNSLRFIKQNSIPYIGAYSFGEALAAEERQDDEPAISFNALTISILKACDLWKEDEPVLTVSDQQHPILDVTLPPKPSPKPIRTFLLPIIAITLIIGALMLTVMKPSFIFGPSTLDGPPTSGGTPIKLKLATYWRSDLPILSDNVRDMARDINVSSNGELEIEVLFAGEAADAGGDRIDPRDLFYAVSNNKVQMVHSASYYWEDRIKGASFFSSVPFGMDSEQMESWIKDQGGLELWRELYKPYNVIPFPLGHTGPQMGGWFNKEIRSIEDFRGMKMRIPGLGGIVLNKAGAITVSIPPQDIQEYERNGRIDAAEWIGPYHDGLLGLYETFKYYYGPGWQERNTMFELLINEDVYNRLPEHLKRLIESKSEEYGRKITREFIVKNADYEIVLRGRGVQFRTFPRTVLSRLKIYSDEVLKEYDSGDTQKIYNSYENYLQRTSPSRIIDR
jgi:TRAP-type mannitol/chloroaromatic compound transport system substrate-binding protein